MRAVGGRSGALWRGAVGARLAVVARTLRRIVGAPDYESYVAHMRRHRPGEPLLSPDAFALERLEARYSRPGSRCC